MRYFHHVVINDRHYRLAPFWRRLGAGTIDLAIGLGLLAVPYVNFFLSGGYLFIRDAWKYLRGRSIGKHLFGLEVISEMHGDNTYLDYATSITRSLPLLVLALDIFVIFLRKDRKRMGDLWANTLVVMHSADENIKKKVSKERYIDIVNHYDLVYNREEDASKKFY